MGASANPRGGRGCAPFCALGPNAGLLFSAHVNLFRRLERGEPAILEAAQTLFYLGH
ncbi:hypothetical protein CRG98_023839 [Punica granatum]|uniref:Uncharacterized protein n=1 Tax=Punica granatum TaxID=22663 RepID=A0A2I0JHP8_PUNGR|nr:hypothetical protein CRG98_023839 [Punica granatum]